MINTKPQFYFLLAVIAAAAVLTFFIFRPFLAALVLALVFTAAFRPLHQKILSLVGGRQALGALITMLIATVVVFTPLTFIGAQIFQEASQLYISFSGEAAAPTAVLTDGNFMNFFDGKVKEIQEVFPVLKNVSFDIEGLTRQSASWFLEHVGGFFTGFAKLGLSFLVFLISLYYFLKSGPQFKRLVLAISPLPDMDDQFIINKLERAINSVLRGGLFIAILQGILAGFGFFVFGVPNAVLWGTVAAVAALIPGVGTSLVLIPAIVFLFITSSVSSAGGLLIWGVVIVGLVDNFLAPKLVGRGADLHPLIVLLSVLGGIALFGPVGFLFGPIAVSFLVALVDVYMYVSKKQASLEA